MALPFFFQVDAGDHFRFIIALPEDDAYMLVIHCISFQCVYRTGICLHIAFTVIDISFLHDVLNFSGSYLPAIHAALGVFSVFQEGGPPVESIVSVDFTL